ncbi:hypothetical protein [Adlercreutzia shanghongiae]|uniref:Uncharacterized protein n=1 Tax=Adlercreutzia shanghongiae TaxID=3111773 RepID=A0ABU6IVH8_9ACTN|nr:hypothetical protein [Adlercreutzia sp. R22]MEC4293837.1 hypothetical protein [Adlercreutzia sp. R22]
MGLGFDEIDRSPESMLAFADETKAYIEQTTTLCELLVKKIDAAVATNAFSDEASAYAAERIKAWVLAVAENLPEAGEMRKRLILSAQAMMEARSHLRRSL